jgi:general secretion pathway protein E
LWARDASDVGLRTVNDLPSRLPEDVATLVGAEIAREFAIVPLGRRPDGRLTLATASVRETAARIGELEFALGPVELVAAEPSAVHALIGRAYAEDSIPDVEDPRFEVAAPTEGAGLAAYMDDLLAYAFRIGASDLHFEPVGNAFRVRLRVDGAMRVLPELPAAMGPALVARLKVMAGLDIGVSRRAQDGRIRLGARDMRLATLPCVAGECAVVRLLDGARKGRTLAELGMPEACGEALETVAKGRGLVVSCGPTGSGKTTTLHALLCGLDADARKIVTIEDPVEYELAGAVQVQARPEIGLGFAEALRSFLRHDPDVILVGEIRDAGTARIAMQAALTGHLVLASLHCRGAAEAPLRLVELGVEPWLVGSAVEIAVAQRLVRKFCAKCGGKGCADCDGSGYAGRTAVFEWLRMRPELAALLDEGRLADYVRAAQAAIPKTMADGGLELIRGGITSREELAAAVDLPEGE